MQPAAGCSGLQAGVASHRACGGVQRGDFVPRVEHVPVGQRDLADEDRVVRHVDEVDLHAPRPCVHVRACACMRMRMMRMMRMVGMRACGHVAHRRSYGRGGGVAAWGHRVRLGSVGVEVVGGTRDGGGAVPVEALCAVAHAVDAAVGGEVLRHRGLQSPRVPARELRSTAHAAAHGRNARLYVHLLRGKGGATVA